jgi:hypothetical protein
MEGEVFDFVLCMVFDVVWLENASVFDREFSRRERLTSRGIQ